MERQGSLYNKHRPKLLGDVAGNRDAVSYLEGCNHKGRFPPVMMFHGPTGCGKTTLARIVKKLLGVGAADYHEVNSANSRGIDTWRQITQSCKYMPMVGEKRLYVIDEAHRMTADAQNAALKLLEDTPEHTHFILCTTDPQKLISAVRGRCMLLGVTLLSEKESYSMLKKIVKAEKDKLDEKVYTTIYDSSQGHPRNAIQILERVLGVKPKKREEAAQQAADETGLVIDLCRLLLKKTSWKQVSTILKALKVQGDEEGVRRQVMGYATSVLLNKDEVRAAFILEEFRDPFYDSGFPGLVIACYTVVKG
jgi:DNA polymerase-3 subunit gamma/tau